MLGIINKGMWYVLGGLVLLLSLSVTYGLWKSGQVNTLGEKLNSVQRDLVASEHALKVQTAAVSAAKVVDAKQSTTRAKSAQVVRAVRDTLKKDQANAQEPLPVVTDSQLDGLRRLADSANAGVRTARELP